MLDLHLAIYFNNFQVHGLVAGTTFIDLTKVSPVQSIVVLFKIRYSQAFRIQLR